MKTNLNLAEKKCNWQDALPAFVGSFTISLIVSAAYLIIFN